MSYPQLPGQVLGIMNQSFDKVMLTKLSQIGIKNQTFNIGSDEQNMTLQQVGELINRLVPSAELVDLGLSDDRRNYRVSFKKVFNMVGFKPQRRKGVCERSRKALKF